MTALVIAEHDNGSIKGATLNAVSAALQCGAEVDVLVAGSACDGAVAQAAAIAGVRKVIKADAPHLGNGLAENIANQVLSMAANYSHILFAATASGIYKDVAEAQNKMISGFSKVYYPQQEKVEIYKILYKKYFLF